MKRVLTMVSILVFGLAPGAMAEDYGWSLSGSSTDPNVNTAPATSAGESFQVHLWLNCTAFDGMTAAEFSLQSNFVNAGFTMEWDPGVNAGDSVDLLMGVGQCPVAPTLIGVWTFVDVTGLGGSACLVSSPGGVNGTVECDSMQPIVFPNEVVGFTTEGSVPCVVGICENPVSVEAASWGSIKGLYR